MKSINAKTRLRKYPVYLKPGLFKETPALIEKNFKDAQNILLVTNDKIFGIYQKEINGLLKKTPFKSSIIIVGDGESYKNLKSLEVIYSEMVNNALHRNDIVIAFGGGVIGDLAGFAASTFHRGLKLIHIPTTIIGQVDSSIGGKVVVNYQKIKNVIGSFYQPHMVMIDPAFLYTLDEDQIINGLAEIVKYGLVFDKKILEKLEENISQPGEERLFSLIRAEAFSDIIYECAKIKIKVVEKDEFDRDYRNLLNFGHTIGHCIEAASDLKKINHGQAVSMGMIAAIDISIKLGLAVSDLKEKAIKLYKKLKLPYKIPGIDTEKIISSLKYDKKSIKGKNKFVLLKGINKPFFYYDLKIDVITDSINSCINYYF